MPGRYITAISGEKQNPFPLLSIPNTIVIIFLSALVYKLQ